MNVLIRPYDAMLIGRARAWGALCMAAAGGAAARWETMVGRNGDRADVERLVARLEATGLAVADDDGVRLTERGVEAAGRTRREGVVPHVVQDDPADWRQRAWTSMRIRGVFTAADVATACDGPSANAVQRYCRDLARAGYLKERGHESRGPVARWKQYVLVRDDGPKAPALSGPERTRETDEGRPWRRRAWSALWRLGAAGEGVGAVAVSAAARVPHHLAAGLLEELHEAGAVVREREGLATGGWQWLYALVDGARELSEPVLVRSDVYDGRATWRHRVWAELVARGALTVADAAAAGGVPESTAYRLLDAAASAGYLERRRRASGRTGPDPSEYAPTAACPPALPGLVLRRAPSLSGASARPEGAVSDA